MFIQFTLLLYVSSGIFCVNIVLSAQRMYSCQQNDNIHIYYLNILIFFTYNIADLQLILYADSSFSTDLVFWIILYIHILLQMDIAVISILWGHT